ncbi:MAG: hypothetical protein RBQ97_07840 [Acholeplasma sp.]|nr:hypothetical protein [Acholeplasma sp.]
MSYEVVVRTYFSIQHIQSAILFAKLAKNLETDYSNKLSEIEPKDRSGISAQHFAFVTNAIFSSVCFLEATINELFCDAFDKNYNERLIPLGESTIDLMKDLWERGIPRTASYSVLEKYQIALVEANKSIFDIGSTPFQDIYLLIKLRNALMHFELEAVSSLNMERHGDRCTVSLKLTN